MNLTLLRWGCLALFTVAIALILGVGASVPAQLAPRYGHRGLERRRALAAGGLFALFEPLVRWIAGWIAEAVPASLRADYEDRLRRADQPLGLSPEELLALSLLGTVTLGAVGFGLGAATSRLLFGGLLGLALGAWLPLLQVAEVIRKRTKSIVRGLPQAIEVCALCMGAGADFPGAVQMLVRGNHAKRDPLTRELSVILECLELGQTRRDALLSFAARVRAPAVRDFVHAVIQAEQKGSPLARVLQVQGRLLNLQRTVAAEEAAARAGVLLIVPMMLLVICVLLLLMGPFLVKGIGL